jgi:hypothetical protein
LGLIIYRPDGRATPAASFDGTARYRWELTTATARALAAPCAGDAQPAWARTDRSRPRVLKEHIMAVNFACLICARPAPQRQSARVRTHGMADARGARAVRAFGVRASGRAAGGASCASAGPGVDRDAGRERDRNESAARRVRLARGGAGYRKTRTSSQWLARAFWP